MSLDWRDHNFAFPVILSESNGELCARMPLNRWPTSAMLSSLFNEKIAQTFLPLQKWSYAIFQTRLSEMNVDPSLRHFKNDLSSQLNSIHPGWQVVAGNIDQRKAGDSVGPLKVGLGL